MYWRKAVELDNASAHANLGIMYENGFGVERDLKRAIELYKMAVAKGDAGAQDHLRRVQR
jgi:TPR repeat protein